MTYKTYRRYISGFGTLGLGLWRLAQPVWAASAAVPDPPKLCAIEQIMARLLEVALGLAGLAVFLMFIYGGFKWLTAGTDEKAVQQARGTFTMAITGLALTMVAWFILLFIEQFTGIKVTTFDIPWIGSAGSDPCP